MKNYIAIFAAMIAISAFAGNDKSAGERPASVDYGGISLVNDDQGYSYLLINEPMSDFAFNSDFKSIGNSGKVGVFKYPDGLEGQELQDYIANFDANDAKYMKKINNGLVEIGDVAEGDRIGFYLDRNNGDLVRLWDFRVKHGTAYIAFDKNGGTGKDEWMSIGEYTYTTGEGGTGGGTVSGSPLPGSLAVLLVGGLLAGARKLRRRG